jgi:hypothetical protein
MSGARPSVAFLSSTTFFKFQLGYLVMFSDVFIKAKRKRRRTMQANASP